MFNKQTTLDLGGPKLGFTTDPQDLSVNTGTGATFVAIGTATYDVNIPAQFATNTGIITFRWYVDDAQVFDDSVFTGTGTTTLQIANNTIGRTVFCEADYIPSAYGLPGVAVTVGSARSTGNAINEPVRSASAILSIIPELSIVTQPEDIIFAVGTATTLGVNARLSNDSNDGFGYQWSIGDTELTDGTADYGDANITVSGSNENVLTLTANSIEATTSLTIKVAVSNSNAFNTPVISTTKEITILPARPIIKIEQISNSSTATLSEHNLNPDEDGEITFTDATHPANQICIFSPEENISVEMELFGGKGLTFNEGTNINRQFPGGDTAAGEGGYSKIRFTIEKNVEYIITGLYDTMNAPFLYRKSNLIACVGEGGDGGQLGDGGDGGGVNIEGENGSGTDAGVGGVGIDAGNLTDSGIFGTQFEFGTGQPLYAEDFRYPTGDTRGGRSVKCSKGIYYRNEGFTSCQDVGTGKFRLSDGTEVTNTAEIERGFKAGYNIMETGGDKTTGDGGNGGNGATGGDAGGSGGGGGGSGYHDGSVTVISTQQGGSTDAAKVIVRLVID